MARATSRRGWSGTPIATSAVERAARRGLHGRSAATGRPTPAAVAEIARTVDRRAGHPRSATSTCAVGLESASWPRSTRDARDWLRVREVRRRRVELARRSARLPLMPRRRPGREAASVFRRARPARMMAAVKTPGITVARPGFGSFLARRLSPRHGSVSASDRRPTVTFTAPRASSVTLSFATKPDRATMEGSPRTSLIRLPPDSEIQAGHWVADRQIDPRELLRAPEREPDFDACATRQRRHLRASLRRRLLPVAPMVVREPVSRAERPGRRPYSLSSSVDFASGRPGGEAAVPRASATEACSASVSGGTLAGYSRNSSDDDSRTVGRMARGPRQSSRGSLAAKEWHPVRSRGRQAERRTTALTRAAPARSSGPRPWERALLGEAPSASPRPSSTRTPA